MDLNAGGEAVAFDIDHASKHLDLMTLEMVQLPLKATKTAPGERFEGCQTRQAGPRFCYKARPDPAALAKLDVGRTQ